MARTHEPTLEGVGEIMFAVESAATPWDDKTEEE